MFNQARLLLLVFISMCSVGCKERADSIHTGTNLSCATHGGSVSCWGKESFFPPDFDTKGGWSYKVGWIRKQYQAPTVSVGQSHFCVLDQGQVECFLDDHINEEMPALVEPYAIAAGAEFNCALDLEGLKCWGNRFPFDNIPSNLSEPYNLVAGMDHICVQDNNGFYCDGFTWAGDGNPTPPSYITHPTKVTTSPDSGITCAMQDQWSCWWSGDRIDDPSIFNAPDADLVVPGLQQTCALTGNEIDCVGFGILGPVGVEVPSYIVNPRDLDIAGAHACAISDWGVGCWSPIGLLSPVNVPPYL